VPGIAFNAFSALAIVIRHPLIGFWMMLSGIAYFQDRSAKKLD
jgi:hypothetical protein